MTPPITSFQGKYRFLSNFWPTVVEHDGLQFTSVEAAYQAAKLKNVEQRQGFTTMSPSEAKRVGRMCPVRDDWEESKLGVMEDLLRQKFAHEELREQLLNTGDAELVEGNWWGDVFWGFCRGKGQNHLGKLLMKIRAEIA